MLTRPVVGVSASNENLNSWERVDIMRYVDNQAISSRLGEQRLSGARPTRRASTRWILGSFLLAALASSAEGRTWIVEADGSGDAPTIQAAILLAQEGDDIEVGPGVYRETVYLTGGRNIDLHSRLGPAVTAIDGEGTRPVLGLDAGIVQGFTIRNGYAQTGAGVFIGQADQVTSPILRNNIIENNRGTLYPDCCVGSGVYNIAVGARIEGNIIRHNEVFGVGGGIWDAGMESSILENTISFNLAESSGGVHSFASSVRGNLILGNFGRFGGGGATLVSCVEFRNNTVVGNTTANSFLNAAGVQTGSFGCVLEQNIIASNRGNGRGIGLIASEFSTVRCNDVWGNDIDTISGPSDPSNFSADPLFCAAEPLLSLNFLLRSNSPCAAGNTPTPSCGQVGARGVGCGTVATAKRGWGEVKQLFR